MHSTHLEKCLNQLLQKCEERGYKKAWVYYRIIEVFDKKLTYEDYLLIAGKLGYKKAWANYKYQDAQRETGNQEYKKEAAKKAPKETIFDKYLQVFGLTLPVKRRELKIAYRKKALETHPDNKITGDVKNFLFVQEAYEKLLNVASDS